VLRPARSPRSTDVAPDAAAAACGQSCTLPPRADLRSGWIILIVSAHDIDINLYRREVLYSGFCGPPSHVGLRMSWPLRCDVRLSVDSKLHPVCVFDAATCATVPPCAEQTGPRRTSF